MGLKNWFSHLNTRIWAESLPREPEDVAQLPDVPALSPLFTFTAWPKTARLLRDIVITEKLDGTNAGIMIRRVPALELVDHLAAGDRTTLAYEFASSPDTLVEDGEYWVVGAQSRNRVITLENDNQGFAKWVSHHAATLIQDLGEGLHFGEFWGNKIGRGYGLLEGDRRFSLFNPEALTPRVPTADTLSGRIIRSTSGEPIAPKTPGLSTVPVLYSGPLDTVVIRETLVRLQVDGSVAVPGYVRPEGIVVYHTHARKIIGKVTLDNQDAGKWEA